MQDSLKKEILWAEMWKDFVDITLSNGSIINKCVIRRFGKTKTRLEVTKGEFEPILSGDIVSVKNYNFGFEDIKI